MAISPGVEKNATDLREEIAGWSIIREQPKFLKRRDAPKTSLQAGAARGNCPVFTVTPQ